MIIEADDFGCNRVISEQCQSHDCRDILDKLHYANPEFKITLFAIPAQMTYELAEWCKANSSWVELGLHGIFHSSNYECEKMTYEEFDAHIENLQPMIDDYFVKVFRAPGWQISDGIFEWLFTNDWAVADQSYNNDRRPKGLPAYVNNNGDFYVTTKIVNDEPWHVDAHHYHVWDCVGNGLYECYNDVENLVRTAESFQFVSEVLA